MIWYNKPEVNGMYLKETVDYEKAYKHLYEKVALMLCSVEDHEVKYDLLRQWDQLRWDMPS